MRALLLLAGLYFVPMMAVADSPPAPLTISVIACRVDDLTGKPGRADPSFAAKGWRDLEWHFDKGNQLECKRETVELNDQVKLMAPEIKELHPHLDDLSQCSMVALQYAGRYEADHPGWGVLAIGCPVQITQDGPNGPVIGWHQPECPSRIGSLEVTCKFDPSEI